MDAIDWSFADVILPGEAEFATARAAIQHPDSRCGHVHRCDEFADILWNILTQDMPQPPRLQVDTDMVQRILNDAVPHCFHFLALDQIGHHLVIEKRAGRVHVFQSYIIDTIQESGRKVGYSAREWVTGRPEKPKGSVVSKGMLKARQRWGGKAPLSYTRLEMLMQLILQLQRCAGEIAEVMYHQLPAELLEQDMAWRARVAKQREAGGTEGLKEQANGPVAQWAAAFVEQPDQMTICPYPDGRIMICMVGYDFMFEIPCLMAEQFCDLFLNLTGEEPLAPVYLMILHFRDWSRTFHLDKMTGKPSAVGWAVCSVTCPH